MSEMTAPVADSNPSFLEKLPKKKIAFTAAAVIVTVAAGVFLKNRVDLDVDATAVATTV